MSAALLLLCLCLASYLLDSELNPELLIWLPGLTSDLPYHGGLLIITKVCLTLVTLSRSDLHLLT